MLPTYPAVLHNGRLKWSGEAPPDALDSVPVRVPVTVLEPIPITDRKRGAMLAAILERLEEVNAFADITNPVAWQREWRGRLWSTAAPS